MKLLHFVLGKADKARATGVNQAIAGLAKYTARNGVEVRIIGKANSVATEGELLERDGFSVQAFSRPCRALGEALDKGIRWADIVHLHGVFSPWNIWVGQKCLRLRKPYLITPHNGLAQKQFVRGYLKKRLFHHLLQKAHIRHAAGIHALTEEEATDILSIVEPRKIFCVPNGVDLEDFPARSPDRRRADRQIVIGYLGRISPEKNLEALCRALVLLQQDRDVKLQIAGPTSSYLKRLLREEDQRRLEWVGPKYGVDKVAFMCSLDLFVHPSQFEGFPITPIEALALGLPLVVTRTSNLTYFYDRNAFFMCEPTALGIARGLASAIERVDEWPALAARGRELVETDLNWNAISKNLIHQYSKLIASP